MSNANPLIKGEHGVSGTKIWFSAFAAIVCIKFAIAGISIGAITIGGIQTPALAFGTFDVGGATAILGVFGGLYFGRRYTEANRSTEPNKSA